MAIREVSDSLIDVGYAGMKDKYALTRQWFSVRQPGLAGRLDVQELMLNQGDEHIKCWPVTGTIASCGGVSIKATVFASR